MDLLGLAELHLPALVRLVVVARSGGQGACTLGVFLDECVLLHQPC